MSVPIVSVKDACAIIKACSKLGVKSLKFCGLEVCFLDSSVTQNPFLPSRTLQSIDTVDESTRIALELSRKQDDLAILAIEDPLAYERHFMSDDSVPSNDIEDMDA